jgi:hypothetical protein
MITNRMLGRSGAVPVDEPLQLASCNVATTSKKRIRNPRTSICPPAPKLLNDRFQGAM